MEPISAFSSAEHEKRVNAESLMWFEGCPVLRPQPPDCYEPLGPRTVRIQKEDQAA